MTQHSIETIALDATKDSSARKLSWRNRNFITLFCWRWTRVKHGFWLEVTSVGWTQNCYLKFNLLERPSSDGFRAWWSAFFVLRNCRHDNLESFPKWLLSLLFAFSPKHEDVILVVMTPKAKEGRKLLKHDVQELGRRCSDLTKLIIIGWQYQHGSEKPQVPMLRNANANKALRDNIVKMKSNINSISISIVWEGKLFARLAIGKFP